MKDNPLAEFTKGAQLERELRALQPGQHFRISRQRLSDITVPANPLDRQTPEYLANWFHSRMPFYCTLHHDIETGAWEIRRPAVESVA